MRIHLTEDHDSRYAVAFAALAECKAAGTVAGHVGFKTLSIHRGGPGFAYALEIQLEAVTRDRGRRMGNSGSYGPGEEYAATYDEWGFFLAALYRMDPAARCAPNFKRDIAHYYDAEDFHEKTGRTYDASYPDAIQEGLDRGYSLSAADDYSFRSGRDQIGRRGAGRVHRDSHKSRYATEAPRTPEFLRELHTGKRF